MYGGKRLGWERSENIWILDGGTQRREEFSNRGILDCASEAPVLMAMVMFWAYGWGLGHGD